MEGKLSMIVHPDISTLLCTSVTVDDDNGVGLAESTSPEIDSIPSNPYDDSDAIDYRIQPMIMAPGPPAPASGLSRLINTSNSLV